MKKTVFAAALTAVLLFAGPAAAEETIVLTLSHFLPPGHGIHKDFIEPWARELEERSGGRVEVRIFPGGTQFGNIAQQLDQVREGVVDIVHGLHGIPRGRFPRTSLIDIPFLTNSADSASRALWAILPEYLAEEYEGLKVLALHAHNPGLIHTRDREVRTIEDLRGLRIRTPSPAVSEMLTWLGATPQGMPPGQVYENLQQGVIDGTVFPWDPVRSFNLAEVLNYHLDARAYTVSFYFVMNEDRYNSLPEDIRAIIDDMSGEALVARFGGWWDSWDAPGRAAAEARGSTISELSAEERERWRAAIEPMIEAWLDKQEADGVDNAREIYAALQREVARIEGR